MSTTNMKITLPTPETTPGPEWAAELNSGAQLVDKHDHSTGKGVKITPQGLNINEDLDINNISVTTKSTKFAGIASVDATSIFSLGGDLYYNNLGGDSVQITSGTNVLSSTDGISRSFVQLDISSNTTILDSDNNSFISVDTSGGAISVTLPPLSTFPIDRFIIIKDASGDAGTNNISILADGSDLIDGAASKSISVNYGISILVTTGTEWQEYVRPISQLDSTYFKSNTVTTNKIQDGAVTAAKLAASNIQVGTSTGNLTVAATTSDTTVASVTITRTGRPVVVALVSDGTNTASVGQVYNSSSTSTTNLNTTNQGVNVKINRSGSAISTQKLFNPPGKYINPSFNAYGYTTAMIYAGGRFIQSGYTDIDNGVSVSTDGINWTETATTDNFTSLTYDGTYYIGCYAGSSGGSTPQIAYSTNGSSWTTASTGGIWKGIAYGNGRYIAVGSNGSNNSAVYSTSATSGWTAAFFSGPVFTDIAYGSVGTIFAATATNGLWTTTNGASGTWTQRISGVSLEAVTFGNGTYVAVGTNLCYSSTNGTTWTARTIPSGTYRDIAFAVNMFVATGDDGKIAISSDGITWVDTSVSTTTDFEKLAITPTGMAVIYGGNGVSAPTGYTTSVNVAPNIAPGSITTIDTSTGTGSTTYSVSVASISGTADTAFKYVKLIAYEI